MRSPLQISTQYQQYTWPLSSTFKRFVHSLQSQEHWRDSHETRTHKKTHLTTEQKKHSIKRLRWIYVYVRLTWTVFITPCVWDVKNMKKIEILLLFFTLRKVVGMFYFSVISVARVWLWCRVLQMGTEMCCSTQIWVQVCLFWLQTLLHYTDISSFFCLFLRVFLHGMSHLSPFSWSYGVRCCDNSWNTTGHLFPLASSQNAICSTIRLIAREQLFSTSFMLWKAIRVAQITGSDRLQSNSAGNNYQTHECNGSELRRSSQERREGSGENYFTQHSSLWAVALNSHPLLQKNNREHASHLLH